MKEMRVILASKSPRRREFLEKLGIDFEIIPAENPEDMKAFRNINKLSKRYSNGFSVNESINRNRE